MVAMLGNHNFYFIFGFFGFANCKFTTQNPNLQFELGLAYACFGHPSLLRCQLPTINFYVLVTV